MNEQVRESWDTWETFNWLANVNESVYRQATRCANYPIHPEDKLKEYVEELVNAGFIGSKIDLSQVDWDELVSDLRDEEEDE